MTRIRFLLLAAATTTACLAAAADAPAKKRLLILGDSISIGYTPFVQKMLADEMTVLRPMRGQKPENCSGTTSGVANIDRWLQIDGAKWDVIHFNWGLHDLKHVKPGDPKGATSELESDPPQATVEVYEKNLREIVAKLKATGAKLIFATTTPVPEGKMRVYRTDADAVRYNQAALRVMKENGIAINDLYAFAKPKLAEIQIQPANVHFTPQGSEALAAEVVKAVRAAVK
ncbi:MAG TPA: SGNH/GDSL hydrolase family protein [Prosthecobacter sp.]|nr:SGNH/GDSL hydrolase family protein [Prosthecobacter sp.]